MKLSSVCRPSSYITRNINVHRMVAPQFKPIFNQRAISVQTRNFSLSGSSHSPVLSLFPAKGTSCSNWLFSCHLISLCCASYLLRSSLIFDENCQFCLLYTVDHIFS